MATVIRKRTVDAVLKLVKEDPDIWKLSRLERAYLEERGGNLQDLSPFITAALADHRFDEASASLRTTPAAQWIETETVQNAIRALTAIQIAFNHFYFSEIERPQSQFVVKMCRLTGKWAARLLEIAPLLSEEPESRNEVTIVDAIGTLLAAIMYGPQINDHFETLDVLLYHHIVQTWIRTAVSSRFYNEHRVNFDGVIIYTACTAEYPPLSGQYAPNGIWGALRSDPWMVGAALVARGKEVFTTTVGPRSYMVRRFGWELLKLFAILAKVPIIRRALVAHGATETIVTFAHKVSRLETELSPYAEAFDRLTIIVWESIHDEYLVDGPKSTIEALNAKLLPALLRFPRALEHHRTQPANFAKQTIDCAFECILRLIAHLVYPSTHRAARRSVRYIERLASLGEIKTSGKLWEAFLLYKETLKSRMDAAADILKKRRICAYPSCALRSRPATEKRKRCMGCSTLEYCSLPCREAHWREHHRNHCAKIHRTRLESSMIAPLSTRDADFVQDLVRKQLEIDQERDLMARSIATAIGPKIPELKGLTSFPTGPVRPNNATDRALGRIAVVFTLDEYGDREKNKRFVFSVNEIDRVEEKERNKRYGDYDPVHFKALVKKRQERQGPLIVIKVSSKIVDITTIERIEKRIYYDEIFLE
ncbi:hypothetical protein CYLTODRAFT_425800 [Cylindrobasidium torrendii FP15055 ss-10]|uniref:MYND-type domain-containing protein n=1 Tax=Cylindrobasidium torrendii FP15055 ss-10 TaxID=1314674 RepID=A0A0D7B2P1_9AGAR|nr:hypothetical protein CYLTODRAFT_425800 [Cylindrobasidium torrendii FP15055 ss-10]